MVSEKQLEANRENAKKSTGPTTAKGKARSRLNALRHGLTGQTVVMPEEDMEVYDKFTNQIAESFDTTNAIERQLAFCYASYLWRINRAGAIEQNMFTLGNMEEVAENLQLEHAQVHNAVSEAKTFRNESPEFSRLAMYTQRLVAQSEKVLKQLTYFQSERRQREEKEMPEAIAAYKAHKMHNLEFDPKANGFELTTAQIEVRIRRQSLNTPGFVAAQAARTLKKAA
jgi:hypothetical protein